MNAVAIRAVGPSADVADVARVIDALTALTVDTVDGGASIGFLGPARPDRIAAFWRRVLDAAARGDRALLLAERDGRIVGTVQLALDTPDNGPHRAEVAKLLVHRDARRRGIADRLLSAVEEEARARGRTLLVLDTVTGSDAERLYVRCGWTRVGVVPDYALFPDGTPCDTTVFYKRLAPPDADPRPLGA
ncbi:MAG: GNAT family N-acetyltransferase [Myxococcota bacterium]